MKRKLMSIMLSVAVAFAVTPALSAYADDDLMLPETPIQIEELEDEADLSDDVVSAEDQEDEDMKDAAGEDEEGDAELKKINLKSPVTQFEQSEIGTNYTLTARIGSETVNPSLITWTSDNEAVATVSSEGIVTVVGVGKANITAVMTDGSARNGTAKIFVFGDKTKEKKKEQKKND